MTTINALVAEGDSLTFTLLGYFFGALGIDNSAWPSDQGGGIVPRRWARWRTTSPALIIADYALSGRKLSDMAAASGPLDAVVSSDSSRRYILAILAGTNLDTGNPTTQAAAMASYCLARRAAGWDAIIVGTIPSRTDGALANFDTAYAQPYNALIKAPGWKEAAGVTVIADYASDPNIGATGAANNTTYFVDKVHPTPAGYALMAPILAAAIDVAIASLIPVVAASGQCACSTIVNGHGAAPVLESDYEFDAPNTRTSFRVPRDYRGGVRG